TTPPSPRPTSCAANLPMRWAATTYRSGMRSTRRLMITHLLGGCTIGPDRTQGAIDEYGGVFDSSASHPTDTHAGLYVVDGSAEPARWPWTAPRPRRSSPSGSRPGVRRRRPRGG